jgi:hypothetical protein
MRDSLRTFCLRQLYQNPACSSKELVELAVQDGYLEASTNDHHTKLLSVLAGIPREERLNNDRFFPGGLGEFRAYDSLVAVLAQSRTLDTTLLRPLLGAVNLALHQDRRFYCLDDGSWYLQHQTIVNDELFTALQKQNTEVSLKAWLETYITKNPGTAPVFWSLDPRFVLEGEHVRLHAHCTLLGEELENLWPVWEAQFAHGARVSTEALVQTLLEHHACVPSALSLEQVLALKGVYPIGNDLWMQEAFIPNVPSVGGAVAFRVSDTLQEEPLAFPSLLVLDSLDMGEVVLTAAHRIYGVLPISCHKAERLYQATGLGPGLGLKPEDHTFEVWHKDGFLFSEALAQRLALLGPGQRLRLSVTEEGLSFELRGFDTRIATTQNRLFSREELLLPHSALRASLLAQVQAEPEGINLSTLIENLGPDYSLSEITLALTSPLIERGPGGFCRYHALSFDPQEAVLALLPNSPESQPQDLSTSPTMPEGQEGPIAQDEFSLTQEQGPSSSEDALIALLDESPETQSPEAWIEFQEEDVEPYITLKEAELLELLQEQDSASEKTSPPILAQATDRVQDADQAMLQAPADQSPDEIPTAQAPSLDTSPISVQTVASEDEKKTFLPLSLEELFSLQSEEEEENNGRIPSGQDVQVLEEESEEDLAELMHSLYTGPEAQTTEVQPIAPDLSEVQALQLEKQDDHPPEVLPVTQEGYLELIRSWKQEGALPVEVEQGESIAEEKPVVLETQPLPIEAPTVLAVEEADEALQIEIAPEIVEQCVEPEELGVDLAEEQEDSSQSVIAAELVAETAEQVGVEIQATETTEFLEEVEEALPLTPESVVSYLQLEDLALVLTGEKLVVPVESVAEVEVMEVPIVLEIHPIPTDNLAVSEGADEAVQLASEPTEQSSILEGITQDLTATKELSVSTESAEPIEGVITPLASESKERLDVKLEELVLDLTGEKLEAPVESVAEVEVQAPIVLEIHPFSTDNLEVSDIEDEAVFFALEPMEQSFSLEGIIQDLTETNELSVSTESVEPLAEVVTMLAAEPKERLDVKLDDLVLDLTGEKPVAPETLPITVEDTFEFFEEIHVEEIHEPIQAFPEPTPFLWIDDLRMDLIKGEVPLQMPTEIPSVTTTSSPEAIAFLNTLFEEEREEPVTEEEEEETSKRPPASLQAKLDQLVAQREVILAQRQPAWTTLMQSVIAQAPLSPQQQEEFQGVWMGTQPVQSHSLCTSVESYLCQLTVLNRLPVTGSLDLFVQALKEHVALGEVDPTGVLESLILPALQYQRTAEGWTQKFA